MAMKKHVFQSLLFFLGILCTACSSHHLSSSQTMSPATNAHLPVPQKKAQRIALLVPLHGPFTKAGEAVRDGFFAAYYAAPDSQKPSIKVYDTSQQRDILAVYQQAMAEQPDFIVGPLAKSDVQTLSRQSSLPVTTLTLNYTDSDASVPRQFYQLGISPEDEAIQVAMKARHAHLQRALLIYPAGRWGASVAQAFQSTFEQAGGVAIDQLAYSPQSHYKKAIARLLKVDENYLAQQKDHKHLVFANRRDDIDMVFLVATPSTARQIVPLLKFYNIGRLPIYATSLAYNGKVNPTADIDLDGLVFCDMPILIDAKDTNPKLYQTLLKLWPNDYPEYARLFALGADSYTIAALGQIQPDQTSNTGQLFLNHHHQLRRKLMWAQIENGQPRLIR